MDNDDDDILLWLLLDSADDEVDDKTKLSETKLSETKQILSNVSEDSSQLIFQYLNIERSKYLLEKNRILQFESKK